MCIMLLRMRAVVVASAEEPWPDSGTPPLKGTPEDGRGYVVCEQYCRQASVVVANYH